MKNLESFISTVKKIKLKLFIETYDKEKIQHRILKKKHPKIMYIDKGLYDYAYFDVAFLNNMLSLIVTSIYKGYVPVVELKDRQEGWTNWDTFFEQPFKYYLNGDKQIVNSQTEIGDIRVSYDVSFNERKIAIWCKIYNDFVVFNEETRKYVENEYDRLLKGKGKILGVKTRGSDFTILKPFGHPIQPEINDVIDLCKQKVNELGYDYIYLASEEKSVENLFELNFPGKVIVNKRVYYDEIINKNNYQHAWQIHVNNENDIKIRGLEYLSSIYLLSKCDALIGGNCGGSLAALFMNNKKYEYQFLFNLGLYGI